VQYREYGNTGKMISVLGFGAMRLPQDDDYAVAIMQRYLDLGGNLIDTARAYGESEKLVGRAIQGRHEDVYISTKNHSLSRGRRKPELWREYFEQSLENLGVDRIDFYHAHDIHWEGFMEVFSKKGGPFDMVQQAQEEGIIGHLCFSSHDSPENIIKLIDEDIFDGMIVQYNMLDRIPVEGGHGSGVANEPAIAHAAEKGMGVLIMGPLAGGRLLMGESAKIKGMLPGKVISVADLGLRFVLANPNVTCAMSGMNEMRQVEENCATASREEPLSDEELTAIREAVTENEKLAELYCTGCNYCQPCPQGVAIPDIFTAMNYHRVWGLTELAKRRYAHLGPDNKDGKMDATACVECGECEEKCPQNLPIIQQLKESHEALSE